MDATWHIETPQFLFLQQLHQKFDFLKGGGGMKEKGEEGGVKGEGKWERWERRMGGRKNLSCSPWRLGEVQSAVALSSCLTPFGR
jgi:hypothetical protein